MAKIEQVYVTITIDTECDHAPDWSRSSPLAFESIYHGLPNLLQPAFNSVEATPTYLLTVEVMEDDASVAAIKGMPGQYELGTHLHAAFIEPQKEHHDYAGINCPIFQCSYPPEIEFEKLSNLTQLFINRFGFQPTSFRAGRYGANHHSLNALEQLGYTVDTSVTPHIKWREPNITIDHTRAPEQPYYPCQNALDKPLPQSQTRPILEVPVTTRPRLFRRNPQWFRPWFSSIDAMKKVAQYHLRKYANNPIVVLNMMFHSMEVIPKASPYPQSEDEAKRFIDDMTATLNWCRNEGMQLVSLKEFTTIFTQR